MGQMVIRIVPTVQALGALADNAIDALEETYGSGLAQQAYLFEYHAHGHIINLNDAEFSSGDGISVVLVRSDIAAAEIDRILTGAKIDPEDHGEYEIRQALLDVAQLTVFRRHDTTGSGGVDTFTIDWELHFKPKAKGGIPFFVGAGWHMLLINRTGGSLTTGAIVITDRVYLRFAYGGF